jgi:hypothetical protein
MKASFKMTLGKQEPDAANEQATLLFETAVPLAARATDHTDRDEERVVELQSYR